MSDIRTEKISQAFINRKINDYLSAPELLMKEKHVKLTPIPTNVVGRKDAGKDVKVIFTSLQTPGMVNIC